MLIAHTERRWNDMGILLFLLGLTVGASIMTIFTKKYKFDEWYLEGQKSIIEAMREKELTNDSNT